MLISYRHSNIIQCKPKAFPTKYLGLPLSDKNLTSSDYLPLLEKIQGILSGWKAPLLSVGGRYILTNAVLTAVPQFFMSVFMLPKWMLTKIDQIRKRFFWHGHKEQQTQAKCLYMVNWALVTKPKKQGGLGIRNIKITNQALLMKWLWQWHHKDQAWWARATPMLNQSDRPWDDPQASPFWKKLNSIAPPFNSSISFTVGNGKSTQFWHDNWQGKPFKLLFPHLYQFVLEKHSSIAQCSRAQGGWSLRFTQPDQILQADKECLLDCLHEAHITQQQDSIQWLRSANSFSVRFAYRFLSHTPAPTSIMGNIWQIKAPLRVTIFAWLFLNNRLATIDNLVRREWQLPNMCAMCKRDEEDTLHLLNQCDVAKQLRSYLHTALAHRDLIPIKFLTTDSAHMLTDSTEKMQARQLEITTSFVIWRERCRRVFSGKELQAMALVREIITEWKGWFHETAY